MLKKVSHTLVLIQALILISTAVSTPAMAASGGAADHEEQIIEWRQKRHDRLADDNGWMTLVGMEWLEEGENTVGSAESSQARIPGGPGHWGTVILQGDQILFRPAAGAGVTVDGKPTGEVRLIADNQGQPSIVRSGDLSFYVIFRESYALRIKDRKAPALLSFNGVPVYDIETEWRMEGPLLKAEPGTTIEIANVLGQTTDEPVFGTFEFERDGQTFSLLALGSETSESLWFIFADKTSGRETYGAGRFLYSDGMPEDGRLVVDFNKAYNPPCAFSDYSTCPLPPQQNRLKLAVRAGEKKYHE